MSSKFMISWLWSQHLFPIVIIEDWIELIFIFVSLVFLIFFPQKVFLCWLFRDKTLSTSTITLKVLFLKVRNSDRGYVTGVTIVISMFRSTKSLSDSSNVSYFHMIDVFICTFENLKPMSEKGIRLTVPNSRL